MVHGSHVSFSFSVLWFVVLGKARTHYASSLSSLSKVAIETVPMFVWLNMDRSWPWRVEMSATSFLHSSFLQAISAVVLWPVHV